MCWRSRMASMRVLALAALVILPYPPRSCADCRLRWVCRSRAGRGGFVRTGPSAEVLPTPPSMDKAAHSHPVYSFAVTPDGKTLMSAGDQTIKFWSFADGRLLNVIKEQGDVGRLVIVPDGTMLVYDIG